MQRSYWNQWSGRLLTRTDLRLLSAQISALSRTHYFYPQLKEYLESLGKTAEETLNRYSSLAQDESRFIRDNLWEATRFLSGSVTSEIPFETVHGLHLALKDWCPSSARELVITTSLHSDRNYFFQGIGPKFYEVVKRALGVEFKYDLVRIALPRLYKHQPLFNAALYHELGHFIDLHFRISHAALLSPQGQRIGAVMRQAQQIPESHFAEYFADLFAASYVGIAIKEILKRLFPGVASYSHPDTTSRTDLIDNFLLGRTNKAPLLTIFQDALTARGCPLLNKRYTAPDIAPAFSGIRPHVLESDQEIHGIFESGYALLHSAETRASDPWDKLEEHEAFRIINDLIEKSIRSRMVITKWGNCGTP